MKKEIIIVVLILLVGGFWWLGSGPSKEDLNKGDKELATIEKEDVESGELSYALDIEQSNLNFEGATVTHSRNGRFAAWNADIKMTGNDLETMRVNILIDMTSMDTGNQGLTTHLMADDFFAVGTYPNATFTSTSIEQVEGDLYNVTGDLKIKGVSSPVTFPATITKNGVEVTAVADFSMDRSAYGIEYEGKTDDLLKDEFQITFELVARAS